MNSKLKLAHLYGIVDLGYVAVESATTVAKSLLDGGAGVIQLRAKGRELDEILELAKKLKPICREAGVPFIVNDFAEVAFEVGADGVHIGQDDGSLSDVRDVVGERMIVGRSTHSLEQAKEALLEGFDYIGFGPLFPTPTKVGRAGIGVENVELVQSTVGQEIPVFCIGGIHRGNLAGVQKAGAQRVVIVSDVLKAENVTEAAREIVTQLRK
ncbi:MAG: thiamine phosphate synthase [Rubritalea sp.]|uniref:thiamine phosphate synthase n=1 Tax=Rubritalea sp. TaxID=2109375 RepID=UPI00324267B5